MANRVKKSEDQISCKYNGRRYSNIDCTPSDYCERCFCCGWNPEVHKARVKKIQEDRKNEK